MATIAAAPRNVFRRLRHVHVPDTPPTYCPEALPGIIRSCTEEIIRTIGEERAKLLSHLDTGVGPLWYNPDEPPLASSQVAYWLARASPPPVVLSFTPRPTFTLPTISRPDGGPRVERVEHTAPLVVAFPKPPGWDRDGNYSSCTPREDPFERMIMGRQPEQSDGLDPPTCFRWRRVTVNQAVERREPLWEVRGGKLHLGLQQPTYQGPGTLSMIVGLDVYGTIQGEARDKKIAEFHQSLEQATIAVLQFEYGLKAGPVDGSSGLWIQTRHADGQGRQGKLRQIAAINFRHTRHVVRFHICINVGQPTIDMVRDDHVANNPWARIGQQKQVTSIVAELNQGTLRTVREHGGPSNFLRYHPPPAKDKIDTADRGARRDKAFYEAFYSTIHWRQGQGEYPAPLGLENYDLASAWAFELAAQLGIEDVDQLCQGQRAKFRFAMHTVSERRTKRRLDTPTRLHLNAGFLDFEQLRWDSEQNINKPISLAESMRSVGRWAQYADAAQVRLKHATLGKSSFLEKNDTRFIHYAQIQETMRRSPEKGPKKGPEKAPVSRMARPLL